MALKITREVAALGTGCRRPGRPPCLPPGPTAEGLSFPGFQNEREVETASGLPHPGPHSACPTEVPGGASTPSAVHTASKQKRAASKLSAASTDPEPPRDTLLSAQAILICLIAGE